MFLLFKSGYSSLTFLFLSHVWISKEKNTLHHSSMQFSLFTIHKFKIMVGQCIIFIYLGPKLKKKNPAVFNIFFKRRRRGELRGIRVSDTYFFFFSLIFLKCFICIYVCPLVTNYGSHTKLSLNMSR